MMTHCDAYPSVDTQFRATVTLRVSGTPSGATEDRTDYWTLSVYEACDLVEVLGCAEYALMTGGEESRKEALALVVNALDQYRHTTAPAVPDVLWDDEGEACFVRHDLAATETQARAVVLAEDGISVTGYEADVVEMLPVPEHFTEIDYEWAVVREGTPSAVRFWRFRG